MSDNDPLQPAEPSPDVSVSSTVRSPQQPNATPTDAEPIALAGLPELDSRLYVDETGQDRTEVDEETRPLSVNDRRLLTPEGERHLFRSLAFLRQRADAIQSTVIPDKPSPKVRREIEGLLEKAGEIRSQIAQANLRLVASIAGRISRNPDDYEEMYAEGNAILLYAIDKFDYSRGFRFSTYLTHAVERHLFRFIKRRSRRSGREFNSDKEHLAHVPEEIEETEFTAEQSIEIARHLLTRIDETLDEREKRIILGRFGLDDSRQEQSFRSLGDDMGLSKERIRQIFHGAVSKLGRIAESFAEKFD